MRKEITLNENEISSILKQHFNLETDLTLYVHGGTINPLEIVIVYFDDEGADK